MSVMKTTIYFVLLLFVYSRTEKNELQLRNSQTSKFKLSKFTTKRNTHKLIKNKIFFTLPIRTHKESISGITVELRMRSFQLLPFTSLNDFGYVELNTTEDNLLQFRHSMAISK